MLLASVSYNQDVNDANKEVEALEKEGYLVVSSYGHDWDCGQMLKKGENQKEKQEVLKEHIKHIRRCREHWKWVNEHILVN